MSLRLVSPVFLALVTLLGSCGYSSLSVPQYEALEGLLRRDKGVDFSELAWSLEWAGATQGVYPVAVADRFVFTQESGVEVHFDGWHVTRVAGLLGREPLTLDYDSEGQLTIQSGRRVFFEGRCFPWEARGLVLEQSCPGLGTNRIARNEVGNILALSFIIHPAYPALVLRRD